MSSLSGASIVSTNVPRLRRPPELPQTPIRRVTIATTVKGTLFESLSPSTVGSVPVGSSCWRINIQACEDHSDEESNGGYDSDGAIGLFFDAVTREMYQYDEAIIDHEPSEQVQPIEQVVQPIGVQPIGREQPIKQEKEQPIEQEQIIEQAVQLIEQEQPIEQEQVTEQAVQPIEEPIQPSKQMKPTKRPVYHLPLVRNLFAQQALPQDILTTVMVEAMNVASLKRELSKRGLRTSGNKGPLTQRLLAAIAAQQQPMEQEQVIMNQLSKCNQSIRGYNNQLMKSNISINP